MPAKAHPTGHLWTTLQLVFYPYHDTGLSGNANWHAGEAGPALSRLVPPPPTDYAFGATLKERLIRIEAEQQSARRPVHLEMDHAMLASGKDVTHVAVERARAKN